MTTNPPTNGEVDHLLTIDQAAVRRGEAVTAPAVPLVLALRVEGRRA